MTYTVTAAVTISTGQTVSFEPALRIDTVSTTAVDFTPSHSVNLAFHRDAFTMAVRPMSDNMLEGFGRQFIVVDPVSRIPIRLIINQEYYQTSWYLDVLYGCAAIRPELAVRVAGAA
jgi:hypothetical protein